MNFLLFINQINLNNMKKIAALIVVSTIVFLSSCIDYSGYGTQTDPTVPDTYDGRSVDVQGTIYVSDRNVTFNVWDSETVDGDIISLIVNGNEVISNYTLTADKKSVSVKLDNNGYNYVILYAHNEGDLPPNTCALSIDDGFSEQVITISADLNTNGAYNIYVE